MTIKLVVTDMDGTFLNDKKEYDRKLAKKVFKELEARGITMMIASGNMVKKLESYFDKEDLNYLYLAGDNGITLDHEGELVPIIEFNRPQYEEVLAYVEQFPEFIPIFSTGDECYILEGSPQWALDQFKIFFPDPIVLKDLRDVPKEKSLIKLALHTQKSIEHQKNFMRSVEEVFDFADSVTSGVGWVDIYPTGGGKGRAVNYMQEKLGITPAETIAFGDSLNDRPMMYESRYSVAMENTDLELAHTACDYQIGSNEEQAVLHVLKEYLTANSTDIFDKYQLKK